MAILDNDGNRILAKYYDKNTFPTAKEQKAFEKNLFNKTHRSNTEIIMLDGLTCVYRSNVDLYFYVMGSSHENEVNALWGIFVEWEVLGECVKRQFFLKIFSATKKVSCQIPLKPLVNEANEKLRNMSHSSCWRMWPNGDCWVFNICWTNNTSGMYLVAFWSSKKKLQSGANLGKFHSADLELLTIEDATFCPAVAYYVSPLGQWLFQYSWTLRRALFTCGASLWPQI